MSRLFATILEIIGFVLLVIAGMYYFLHGKDLPSFLPGYDPQSTAHHTKEALMAVGGGIVLFIISFFIK